MMVVLIAASALLTVLLLSAIIYIIINSKDRLNIFVSAPSYAYVGDKLKIDFRVVNHSKHSQVFEMLSLDKRFLDSFNFISILPHAKAQASAFGRDRHSI